MANMSALRVGDSVFYNGRPVTVRKIGIKGEYGPRVELSNGVETTPGLDHHLTATADEVLPSLSSLLWRGV